MIIQGRQLLLVSEQGIGKRTNYDEFTSHHRGSGGVRAMRLNDRTGKLVGAWGVSEDDELIVITGRGRVVRIGAGEISTLGRAATGYTVIKLDDGDVVADISVVKADPAESEEG